MSAPPPVFAKAQVALAGIVEASGLAMVHDEYNEAAFGSAYTEFRGRDAGLRLVWDGKDATLVAEVLVAGRWVDVETLAAGRPLEVDHDQSDQRIARVLAAASAALSSRGGSEAAMAELEHPSMTRPWCEIEERFRSMASAGPAFSAMLQLVMEIMGSRYAHGLHAWTSMHTLCIVQQPTPYRHDLPHLRISPQADGQLEFRFVDTAVPERQWHRTVDGDHAFGRLTLFLEQLHWFA